LPAAFLDAIRAAYNRRMAARRINDPIEPMTLGNMRRERRAVARRVMLAKPPPGDHQRGTLAG
jgi:hypothetical protein